MRGATGAALSVVARLDRAIQYSRGAGDQSGSLGVLDIPPSRDMTTVCERTIFAPSRHGLLRGGAGTCIDARRNTSTPHLDQAPDVG